jgi:NADH-quinone oxidoreductase subunit N
MSVCKRSIETFQLNQFELPILLLSCVLGMMLMCSANDFLTVFMAIELMSLSLYVILALKRKNLESSEASLKYFILGALASGLMLYGISWIYGFAGSTDFTTLERFLSGKTTENYFYILFGFALLLSGLSFKVAAAPFHNWAPDVYQGIPLPILTFLATVPKFSMFALLLRLLTGPFNALHTKWWFLLAVVAVASMLVGGIATLTQRSIKRFVAYSAIGQIGFAMMGLSLASEHGYTNTLLFLVYYMIAAVGFLAILMALSHDKKFQIQRIEDFAGLGKNHPILATCLGFFVLSMAGIPPFAGFMPKLLLLQTTVSHEHYTLAFIGVMYSVLAAAYYLFLIKAMFIDTPTDSRLKVITAIKIDRTEMSLIILLVLVLLAITIAPNPLVKWISHVISFLVYV